MLALAFIIQPDTTVEIDVSYPKRTELAYTKESFEDGMRKQDSLWNDINAIWWLEDRYFIRDKRYYEQTTFEWLKQGTEIIIKK